MGGTVSHKQLATMAGAAIISETVGDGESGGAGLEPAGQPVTEGLVDGVAWSFSFPSTLGLCEVPLNTEELFPIKEHSLSFGSQAGGWLS